MLSLEEAGEAHRQSAKAVVKASVRADLILVIDDGRIAAQGTHSELLANSPIYREIYESQVESGVLTNVA